MSDDLSRWPYSERLLKDFLEQSPEILKENIDELIDDAFCFEVPQDIAKLWLNTLEQRADQSEIKTTVEQIRWFAIKKRLQRKCIAQSTKDTRRFLS